MVLIKTSLLAFDMFFSFHPITLFNIHSWRSLKVLTFDLPPTIRSPKYFSQLVITCAPNKFWMSSLSLRLVLWLNNCVVLYLLMAWHEASSYQVRISSSWQHSPSFASQNNKLSSANRRWEIRTPPPPLQEYTPVNWRVSATFLIKEDNPSTQRRKRYWDKGSPYLMPQARVMKHVGSPLISIKYEAVHTVSIAKFTHCVGSPILSIIYRRNSHSTLS